MRTSLARWADHHRVPLLRGTDGLTWRERRRYAEQHRATIGNRHLQGRSS